MTRRSVAATVVACLVIATTLEAIAGDFTDAERRGRRIYRTGRGDAARPIIAVPGGGAPDVPATALPCAGCHGLDGRGTVEGGLAPPSIRWSELTKPYGHTHERRAHGPYTEASLAATIELAVDPAGNRLIAAKPTYRMAPEDLRDLIAYLKVLGTDADPGVTDTTVRLGLVVPAAPGSRGAAAAALRAYIAEVNAAGGVYGRMLELRTAAAGGSVGSATAAARQLLDHDDVFAMLAMPDAATESEIVGLLHREEVPLIAPLAMLADARASPRRSIFYLASGLPDQARALVEIARQRHADARAAIVASTEEDLARAAAAAEQQCRTLGWPAVAKVEYTAGRFDAGETAQRLQRLGAGAVFFLGHGRDAVDLVRRSVAVGLTAPVYAIGATAGRELLGTASSLSAPLSLAYPIAPAALTAAAAADYRALAENHRLPAQHLAAQLIAHAAGRVVVESLRRAGRDLTRDRMIGTLEGLSAFDSGVSPPITFGPNRRVGAVGAWIVTFDPRRGPHALASEWVTPRDGAAPARTP